MSDNYKDLIEKFFYGSIPEEDIESIEKHLVEHANHKDTDQILMKLLDSCEADDDQMADKAFYRFVNKLQFGYYRKKAQICMLAAGIAACVAILMSGMWLNESEQNHSEFEWIEACANEKPEHLLLPDSSVIYLHPHSRIIYPSRFEKHARNVFVSGEVYAAIHKDAHSPFVMNSNQLKIRVLGTKFILRSYLEDSDVEVRLFDGSICLESHFANQNDSTYMKPGDVIKIDKQTGDKLCLNNQKELDFVTSNSLCFLDQRLEDIVHQLNRHFNVDIIIDSKSLSDTRYYAIYANNESLQTILSDLNTDNRFKIKYLTENLILISE